MHHWLLFKSLQGICVLNNIDDLLNLAQSHNVTSLRCHFGPCKEFKAKDLCEAAQPNSSSNNHVSGVGLDKNVSVSISVNKL